MRLRLAVLTLCASLTVAQGLVRQQIEFEPGSSLAHYQMGRELFAQRNFEAAIQEFEAALNGDLNPPDIKWWAHQKLGEVYMAWGRQLLAPAEFEDAERFKTDFDDSILKTLLPPKVLERAEPKYTEQARRAGLEGDVLVRCQIGEDGSVRQAAVSESLGLGLDEKAVEYVRRWRIAPALLNGRPISYAIEVMVAFQLPHKQSRWHLVGASFLNGQDVKPPEIITAKYPIGAGITMAAVEEGRILGAIGRLASATIAFEIDKHGRPGHFSVQNASHQIWGSEAINLLRQWQFEPGTKDGVAIAVPCVLEFVWGPRDLPPQALRDSHRYAQGPK